MSVAVELHEQKLWNAYKTFSEEKGKGGELDDLFGDEQDDDDEDEDDVAPGAGSDDDEDEDDDAPAASGDDDEEEEDDEEDAPRGPPAPSDDTSDDEPEKSEAEKEEGDDTPADDAEGSDDAGETGDLNVAPATFDEELAQKISDDARTAGMDAEYIIYSRDFDVLAPLVIDTSDQAKTDKRWNDKWVTEMEDETRGMTGVMQRDIERMMAARSQVLRVPGFRSGRLHSSALHRVVAGDSRVFRRKQEHTSKDVAICLLNDNSGSMHGEKMKTAMTASYALSSTLERVAIKHEVLGFTTMYNRTVDKEASVEEQRTGVTFSRKMPIYMPIYKGFDERLNPEIKQRFAGAPRAGFMNANVDGESVEYAVGRLLKRSEKRKVLIVLSDGQPAADGDYYQQIAHLHRVIATAEKMGVETVGIGILSDAVKHFYPKHFVLNKVEQLPGLVMQELKRILMG